MTSTISPISTISLKYILTMILLMLGLSARADREEIIKVLQDYVAADYQHQLAELKRLQVKCAYNVPADEHVMDAPKELEKTKLAAIKKLRDLLAKEGVKGLDTGPELAQDDLNGLAKLAASTTCSCSLMRLSAFQIARPTCFAIALSHIGKPPTRWLKEKSISTPA